MGRSSSSCRVRCVTRCRLCAYYDAFTTVLTTEAACATAVLPSIAGAPSLPAG